MFSYAHQVSQDTLENYIKCNTFCHIAKIITLNGYIISSNQIIIYGYPNFLSHFCSLNWLSPNFVLHVIHIFVLQFSDMKGLESPQFYIFSNFLKYIFRYTNIFYNNTFTIQLFVTN